MRFAFIFFAFIFFQVNAPLFGEYQEYQGKWVTSRYTPYLPLSEHMELARGRVAEGQWRLALSQLVIITHAKAPQDLMSEALFSSALCEYHLKMYEEANDDLTLYLNEFTRDQRYNDIFDLKFKIASAFADGARRHLFGWRPMPKILSAKNLAVDIFDEVAVALPRSDLAAQALLEKGKILRKLRKFNPSNQAFSQIVTEFDRHPLVLQSFEELSYNYFVEMETTSRSEELLELAKINRQKMQTRFPNADGVALDEKIHDMRELYAQGLLDLSVLYKKKGHKEAAFLYLGRLSALYSDTASGKVAIEVLDITGLSK